MKKLTEWYKRQLRANKERTMVITLIVLMALAGAIQSLAVA